MSLPYKTSKTFLGFRHKDESFTNNFFSSLVWLLIQNCFEYWFGPFATIICMQFCKSVDGNPIHADGPNQLDNTSES